MSNSDLYYKDAESGFELCARLGDRPYQEDAAYWCILDKTNLEHLTPKAIGANLFATYKRLNDEIIYQRNIQKGGTTAVTVVFDGNHLITASLGDSVAFLVVYDMDNKPLLVTRLNKHLHSPTNEYEKKRIESAGYHVLTPIDKLLKSVNNEFMHKALIEQNWMHLLYDSTRIYYNNKKDGFGGGLEMSRSIGDFHYKKSNAVCSDATIDIVDIKHLLLTAMIPDSTIGKFQVLVASDGFTQPVHKSIDNKVHKHILDIHKVNVFQDLSVNTLRLVEKTKQETVNEKFEQERYVEEQLLKSKACASSADLSHFNLATELVNNALGTQDLEKDSDDNVLVGLQTFQLNDKAFMLGVYDGHNGSGVSYYVTRHVGQYFREACQTNLHTTHDLYPAEDVQASSEVDIKYKRNVISREELKWILKQYKTSYPVINCFKWFLTFGYLGYSGTIFVFWRMLDDKQNLTFEHSDFVQAMQSNRNTDTKKTHRLNLFQDINLAIADSKSGTDNILLEIRSKTT